MKYSDIHSTTAAYKFCIIVYLVSASYVYKVSNIFILSLSALAALLLYIFCRKKYNNNLESKVVIWCMCARALKALAFYIVLLFSNNNFKLALALGIVFLSLDFGLQVLVYYKCKKELFYYCTAVSFLFLGSFIIIPCTLLIQVLNPKFTTYFLTEKSIKGFGKEILYFTSVFLVALFFSYYESKYMNINQKKNSFHVFLYLGFLSFVLMSCWILINLSKLYFS